MQHLLSCGQTGISVKGGRRSAVFPCLFSSLTSWPGPRLSGADSAPLGPHLPESAAARQVF